MSPILAYFSTSYDPSKVDPETGEKYKTLKVTVYKHKDDKHQDQSKQRVQVVISPPGANVEFVGTNYSGEQAASPTTGYALGILNRETKRMRILPVAYNKIIRLEPNVKNQEIEASGSERVTKASDTNLLFGTKASINQDKKKRALNLGDDLQTQKFLEEKFNKLDINASARTSTSSSVARNIPPYDASATTASEAYPLEKIIQKREWNFLKDIYQLLQQESGAAGKKLF